MDGSTCRSSRRPFFVMDGVEPLNLAIIETPIGRCGLVWGCRGVRGLQLPEASDGQLLARVRSRHPLLREVTPDAEAAAWVAAVESLLRGERRNLREIPLDLEGAPPFNRQVYEAARRIDPGETRTYGEIAAELGDPGFARAVGQALGQNPIAIIVPCHRVLAAGGRMGGFSAHGGVSTKRRLLEIEGALAERQLELF